MFIPRYHSGYKICRRYTGHVRTPSAARIRIAGNGARAKEPVNKSFSSMQELRLNFFLTGEAAQSPTAPGGTCLQPGGSESNQMAPES